MTLFTRETGVLGTFSNCPSFWVFLINEQLFIKITET